MQEVTLFYLLHVFIGHLQCLHILGFEEPFYHVLNVFIFNAYLYSPKSVEHEI